MIPEFLSQYRALVNTALESSLARTSQPNSRLEQAMRYSLLLGGKRIRPILCMITAKTMGQDPKIATEAACALEFIHSYSLIHDDLPAMDDDDLRRGQASCHIQFDEATAILAADALQASAFELLATESNQLDCQIKVQLIQELARASGAQGMVLGQAIDLAAAGTTLDLDALERMHRHKTGKLIEASVVMGAIVGQASQEDTNALRRYAAALGLAFQVQDDVLDVVGETAVIGKAAGSDRALDKPTYVTLLGLDRAKDKLDQLLNECSKALASIDADTDELEAIARYVIERES